MSNLQKMAAGRSYGVVALMTLWALFLPLRGEAVETETRPLNLGASAGPKTAATVAARRVKEALLAVKARFYSNNKGLADYKAMQRAPEWRRYRQAASLLRTVDLQELHTVQARKAFWINVYNALVADAIFTFRVRGSVLKSSNFFRRARYQIGNYVFSLDEIEHGILRGNRPSLSGKVFKKGDPRLAFIVRPFDPRIHFALNCGARSCPPVGVYDATQIEAQLDSAARNFIRYPNVQFDENQRTILDFATFSVVCARLRRGQPRRPAFPAAVSNRRRRQTLSSAKSDTDFHPLSSVRLVAQRGIGIVPCRRQRAARLLGCNLRGIEGVMAGAVQIAGNVANYFQHDRSDPLRIFAENGKSVPRVDRPDLALGHEAAVIVRDDRDGDRRDILFQREVIFRILRHADHVPTRLREPPALRLRGEARALNDHDRSLRVDGYGLRPNHFRRDLPQVRTIRIRRADMHHFRPAIEGILAPACAIHALIAHDEMLGFDMTLKTARRTGTEEKANPQLFHGPDVGAIVDFVRRYRMASAMPGQKRDRFARIVADEQAVAWKTIGRFYVYFTPVFQQRVESTAAKHADFCDG